MMKAVENSDRITAMATYFGEADCLCGDCGKIKDEMFAGKVAEVAGGVCGGDGVDGTSGKNGFDGGVNDENGYFGSGGV